MKIKDIGYKTLLLIFIPIILVIVLALIPIALLILLVIFVYHSTIGNYYRNKREKLMLERHSGEIFLFYNLTTPLHSIFSEDQNKIEGVHYIGILSKNGHSSDINNLLLRKTSGLGFPRIIQIQGTTIINKQHYGTYKHYIKRKNNEKKFLEIIESSINNLIYAK